MQSGDADQAIRMLREAYEQMPDASHIMELGVGYLWVKDYQAAWNHFQIVNQERPLYGAAFYGMDGVAKWCMNDPEESVRQWRAGLKCQYADGAGGVKLPLLLFITSVIKPIIFSKAEAEKLLTVRANDRHVKNWPGPVAEYLLGRIDEKGLRSKCVGVHEDDTFMRHWMTDFFMGVLELARGNIGHYQEIVRKIGETSVTDYKINSKQFLGKLWHEEFFLARHEATVYKDKRKEI